MFESLSTKMAGIVKRIKGEARITEKNTQEILREIRLALLEADVALPVVKEFLNKVKEKALGNEVLKSLTPGQAFVGVVNQELIKLMENDSLDSGELNIKTKPPAIILLAGLQGTGKTTTCGKLAVWLKKQNKNIKILTVSCDIHRPAAIKQLQTISEQAEVDFCDSDINDSVVEIAEKAINYAKKHFHEILIIDTAGRLAVDEKMMEEITQLQKSINPIETLFVVDSMQGQDALEVAKNFNSHIKLTGIILTKLDGDSRGGSLLSVKSVTGCPTKFIGVSEKLIGLEKFDAQRFAKRLLGMGDVLSIIEKAQQSIDQESAVKLIDRIKTGKKFTLNEYRLQINQMISMGGLSSLVGMLPNSIKEAAKGKSLDSMDNTVKKQESIIFSMTPLERNSPEIIKSSRKKRIANGAGVQVQEVNRLINQFEQMQSMMKKIGGGTINKMMQPLSGMPGLMSPNLKNFAKQHNRKKRRSKRR